MARSDATRRPGTLFVDIGGVLLSDGWGRMQRQRAVDHFGIAQEEFFNRHAQIWNTYQLGKCTLDDYLDRVLFWRDQPFARDDIKAFMLAQSEPCPQMLALIAQLKARFGLKIVVVSNEGRELNAHRIATFKLDGFVDLFVSSCYVQLLKPDPRIFRLALDLAQVTPADVVYIENTAMFVELARDLGIRSLLHCDYAQTRAQLAALGLTDADGTGAATVR